jgi:hypothetical protein
MHDDSFDHHRCSAENKQQQQNDKNIFSVFSIIACILSAQGNRKRKQDGEKNEGPSIVTDSGRISRGSKKRYSQY